MYGQEISVGTMVRIVGFPRPTDPNNHLNFNGLVGQVTKVHSIPFGSGRIAGMSYEYEVTFKNVTVKKAVLDPATRKLKRSNEKVDAVYTFNESYVEAFNYPNYQQDPSQQQPIQRSMPLPQKPTVDDLPPLPSNMPVPEKKEEPVNQNTMHVPIKSDDELPEVESIDFFFTQSPEEENK